MTKFILALITFLSVGYGSRAQSIYTSANYAHIGDSFLYSSRTTAMNLNFDTTGANIVWDYSTLLPKDQRNEYFIDPQSSGYKSTWCLHNNFVVNCNTKFNALTNLAYRNRDTINIAGISAQNQVDHYRKSTNVLEETMIGFTAAYSNIPLSFTFNYDKPDTILEFPIHFGDRDTTYSHAILDFSPLPVKQVHNNKRINNVNGWGKLITPYGTFNNVIKMSSTVEKNDTTIVANVVIPTLTTEFTYKWFDPNYGFPVLKVTGTRVGTIETITKVEYLDSPRCVKPNALFTYQPSLPLIDPITDSAEVMFNNLSTSVDSLLWVFGDGTTSSLYNPTHKYACTGTYTPKLYVYNKCTAGVIIDSFTLPIFVNDLNAHFDTLSAHICYRDSFFVGGKYRKLPGYYTNTYATAGCDSSVIVDLDVTIINTSVNQQGGTLHAANTNADSYQWLRCNNYTIIPGATDSVYSPSNSGLYALALSKNGCFDTSWCKIVILDGIKDLYRDDEFHIYPNPTTDYINIDLIRTPVQAQAILYSIYGQAVMQFPLPKQSNRIPLKDLPTGTYFLRVTNDGIWTSSKIIHTQ